MIYYKITEILDDFKNEVVDYAVITFEYIEPDSRGFLLRECGYRGKTFNRIRISNEDTYLCHKIISDYLEKLDLVYVKLTLQTYRNRNYIDIEDIGGLFGKLIMSGLIKEFNELSNEEQNIVQEKLSSY